ncbi:MAG TPA: substrate-binding domain-containing protein, partial [Paraburkholderia sp.]|nr:substrate-binding domain-containing protein [Paraburkholderia sp.]
MSAAQTAQAAPLKIGMTFQELNNPYFVTMQKALNDAAASTGATVVVTDAHHDVSKQVSDVEDMLQKKIDILLVNPTDSTGIQSAVMSAKKAGVVVVAVDANANGPVDSFVGSKNYDAGVIACDYLAKSIGGSGEVAILDGIPVVPILERVRGCKAALAKSPGVKLVDTQNGKQERATALSVTENMIQAHPNLKGVFSVNDGGSMGALSAIESSGKDIKLTSVDGAPE